MKHPSPVKPPSAYELMVLSGMQKKPMYGGTVPADTVAKRRQRNRAASKSRRTNRGGK